MEIFGKILMLALLLGVPGAVFTQSAGEPLVFHLFRPAPRLQLTVLLQTPEGDRLAERKLGIFSDTGPEGVKLKAEVLEPATLRNLKFLRVDQGDTVQMWVKSSRGVRRLTAGGRPEPLFGSVFTTEDFDLDGFGWKTLSERDGWVTLEREKSKGRETLRQVAEVRKADSLLGTLTTFGPGGKEIRKYEVLSWSGGDALTGVPRTLSVTLPQEGRRSTLEILQAEEPLRWPPNTFSSGAL